MGFEIGDKVVDVWYRSLGIGKVTKVLKTRVHVTFSSRTVVYDKAHAQFLRHRD